MVWIYLVESEESVSHLKNGCDQSPIAKSTPIVKECCSTEWPMNYYAIVLSGMTYEHYQYANSLGVSTSYMEAFRARTLALPVMEKAWKESEANYFMRSLGCAAKLSHDSSFWKMYQPSLLEEEPKWLEKLPRWGMTVDGALYPLRPLERCIKGKDGSYWPSPDASDSTRGPTKTFNPKAKSQSGRTLTSFAGGKLNPNWVEKLMGYPFKWTELEDWAMQWFRNKQKKRLKS